MIKHFIPMVDSRMEQMRQSRMIFEKIEYAQSIRDTSHEKILQRKSGKEKNLFASNMTLSLGLFRLKFCARFLSVWLP